MINIDKVSYSSNYYNTKEFNKNKNYKFIKCDINNKKIKDIFFKYKPSAVFNLAAETHVDRSIDNPSDFIKSNWKKVDILINNAGKLINKPFPQLSSEDFLEVYKVNVFAVAEITKRIIPYLQKGSHVITVSSMGGIQGSTKFPGLAAYSSAKGAVITLSELLAEEYKDHQIAFNVLAIGAVQTEMLKEAFPDYKAPLSAKEMANYIFDFSLT